MAKQLLFSTLFLAMVITGCNNQQATTEEALETEETTETTMEVEEEQERPSPLRQVSGTIDGVSVNMQYSSPGVKGRTVWGDLVKYGEVWRTGANEATWVEFDKDAMVGGEMVPAGKYALFTVPAEEGDWEVILNSEWNQWGAYDYDEAKNVARFMVSPASSAEMTERMDFKIGENIVFQWENMMFAIPVEAAG